jgi:hypothetical protein
MVNLVATSDLVATSLINTITLESASTVRHVSEDPRQTLSIDPGDLWFIKGNCGYFEDVPFWREIVIMTDILAELKIAPRLLLLTTKNTRVKPPDLRAKILETVYPKLEKIPKSDPSIQNWDKKIAQIRSFLGGRRKIFKPRAKFRVIGNVKSYPLRLRQYFALIARQNYGANPKSIRKIFRLSENQYTNTISCKTQLRNFDLNMLGDINEFKHKTKDIELDKQEIALVITECRVSKCDVKLKY